MSFLKDHRERITRVLLWLLVLLPIAGSVSLARTNSVNQRFLDDWEWTGDLVKFKEGRLRVSDLFEVYLEHRPAVPRALALGATLLGRGDIRAECVLTALFLGIAFFALSRLWLKNGNATIREAWLPLLIVAAVLFTPVQWQTLLWPICFGTVMPCMFLALTMCAALKPWPAWVRCAAGTLLALLAMLSFASGVLLWVLPLPVYLLCGSFTGNRARTGFAAAWLAVMVIVFAVYLQVKVQRHDSVTTEKTVLALPGGFDLTYDLRNEVPRQYAYGQEHENTMAKNMPYFREHKLEDIEFVLAFSGVLPVRGWAVDTRLVAMCVGAVLLCGLAILAFCCWHYRRERVLFSMLFTMLCFGLYTPATGVLVAMGRIWAGHVSTALNVRYHPHHTQIIIALVGAVFFLVRHHMRKREAEGRSSNVAPAWIAGGLVLGVLGLGWFYGAHMMEAWRSARFRNAAAQLVCKIFPNPNRFVSYVSGNFQITQDSVEDLTRNHLLLTPPLTDTKLGQFPMSRFCLGPEHAEINRLWKEGGAWHIEGSASLPRTNRIADGVLLAYRVPGGEWTIWGFTQGNGPPEYLTEAMTKDLWGIVPMDQFWPAELMCPVDDSPTICAEPPPGSQISFWAMDMEHRQIERISRERKTSPDADGELLESLAQRWVPEK